MRHVTLCLAYYRNPGMLQEQYDNLRGMPVSLRQCLSLIVVDDGSPKEPAVPPDPDLGIWSFALFRMLVDVPWNQDACRNLAMSHVDGWALLTDMDHMPTEAALHTAVCGKLDEDRVYRFARVSAPLMDWYKPHPNSWLLTRETYDRIGGYDERFAGVYGTDGRFAGHVREIAGDPLPIKEPLIRVPRELVPDASTTVYRRKTPENDALKVEVRERIKALPPEQQRPVRGLFPWERVA